MTDSREELKGKLLVRWLEDLREEKKPGLCEEMNVLSPTEIEEVMSLARFAKATFYPNEVVHDDMGSFARNVSKRFSDEFKKQIEANTVAIRNARSFGGLVRTIVRSQGIDHSALRDLVKLPNSVLSDLETGQLSPHRISIDKMVRLLLTLRLASTEVVDLVRKSSLEWAESAYGRTATRLGRIDVGIGADERTRLMDGEAGTSEERQRIEEFCSGLASALRSL